MTNPEGQNGQQEIHQPVLYRCEIVKAKMKNELFLDIDYSETTIDGTNTVGKGCNTPMHDDCIATFKALDEHLAELCEQFVGSGKKLAKCSCTGFTISGKTDEGVVLMGTRELSDGKTLNLTSPFYRFGDVPEVENLITDCQEEVKKYLFEGKRRPEAQQEIEFPENNETGL